MLSPTSSASPSTTSPSAPITSLPSPPTPLPPSVVQALEIIRACYQGHPPDDQWIKIHMEVKDYEILQQQLRQEDLWGYMDDKIRYDWNPFTGELIYRMPATVHNVFKSYIIEEIYSWLHFLTNRTDADPCVRTLAAAIINCGSAQIFYRVEYDREEYAERSPDSSFSHIEAQYPGIVIETSFPQKRKELPKLAYDYIIGSTTNISTVLGLDIDYHGTKKATISIWKPNEFYDEDNVLNVQVTNVINVEPFRNDDGSPVPDRDLILSFGDFVPASMTSSITSPLPSLTIPYSKLANFLQLSEAFQEVQNRHEVAYRTQKLSETQDRDVLRIERTAKKE